MARHRMTFSAWGIPRRLRDLITGTCYRHDDESAIGAVCRHLERQTRLSVVACRLDNHRRDRGVVIGAQYEITLGRGLDPRYGGGYSVDGRVWVEI
jgi:hypothetical protein